ncbi:hypothetical protein PG995_009074 [Apiospora arundinis]
MSNPDNSSFKWTDTKYIAEKEHIERQRIDISDAKQEVREGAEDSADGAKTNDDERAEAAPADAVYELSQSLIKEKNSAMFCIELVAPLKKTSKTPRFTIPPNGLLRLVLEGLASGAGEYVLQLNELWNHSDYEGKEGGVVLCQVQPDQGCRGRGVPYPSG